MIDLMEDIVHRPELFEARSWLVINVYRPLAVELEASPRSNRKESPKTTEPYLVEVTKPLVRRTGARGSHEIYASLRKAMADHGRWVRTSIEDGRPTEKGTARRIE